ncbi:MBOAT, membrane-bound O-acyltransferase family-domain-containing protein [Gongronella butleri]|nr:MBOAT, membrane-bound O-acyltransferase family-domain-containing protein [Gongronella butleri]
MSFLLTEPVVLLTGLPEPSVRLVETLLLGYLAAYFYDRYYVFHPQDPQGRYINSGDRNTFVLLSGLALSLFFNGIHIVHSLVTVLVSYVLLSLGVWAHHRQLACIAVWVLNGAYLLGGYYYAPVDAYDISWTMSQCVLCLRLMGLAMDVYDGDKVAVYRTNCTYPMAFDIDAPLPTMPSLQSVVAYCFFPPAFLIGPQFSYALYRRWLLEPYFLGKPVANWDDTRKAQAARVGDCISRAVLYLALQYTIGARYPSEYLLTDQFLAHGFLHRLSILFITGFFVYLKYIGVWLLTEGACVAFGITYDGQDKDEVPSFGGLSNVLDIKFFGATCIDDVISSFNINTNLWCKKYVFKRMRFAGDIKISQLTTLLFLATWHGFASMYYITFFLEFACIESEKIVRRQVQPVARALIKAYPALSFVYRILCWITCQITIFYAIIGFELLSFERAWAAYKSVYFIGHLLIPIIYFADCFLPMPRVDIHERKKAL